MRKENPGRYYRNQRAAIIRENEIMKEKGFGV